EHLQPREHERDHAPLLPRPRLLPWPTTRPTAASAMGTISPSSTERRSFGNGGRLVIFTIPKSSVFFASFQVAHAHACLAKKNTNSTMAMTNIAPSIVRRWPASMRSLLPSVAEHPPIREHHRHPRAIGGGDDLFVLDRAAGLDDGAHAGGDRVLHAVREREEAVARERRAGQRVAGALRLHDRHVHGVHAR